jgi:hypothetical protein
MAGPVTANGQSAEAQGTRRLDMIRRAALVPLSVLTPPLTQTLFGAATIVEQSTGLFGRFLVGTLLLAGAQTAVTLRDPTDTVVTDVDSTGLVSVRVAYVYACPIPIGSALFCHSGLSLLTGLERLETLARATLGSRLGRVRLGENPTAQEFSRETRNVSNPDLLRVLLATGGRFKLLTATATLPNQGACYYPGSSCYRGKS